MQDEDYTRIENNNKNQKKNNNKNKHEKVKALFNNDSQYDQNYKNMSNTQKQHTDKNNSDRNQGTNMKDLIEKHPTGNVKLNGNKNNKKPELYENVNYEIRNENNQKQNVKASSAETKNTFENVVAVRKEYLSMIKQESLEKAYTQEEISKMDYDIQSTLAFSLLKNTKTQYERT